ncbi:MAG TPA: hypothetical protein VN706_11790 [Gemmatimonadaceae bacterium]|nr:hypothetical protein [Gemmatimonadaceae bacterium]
MADRLDDQRRHAVVGVKCLEMQDVAFTDHFDVRDLFGLGLSNLSEAGDRHADEKPVRELYDDAVPVGIVAR